MEQKIRIGISNRYRLLNQSLETRLASVSHLQVAGTAGQGRQVLELVRDKPLDVLLFDADYDDMDSLDLVREVVALNKKVALMVFLLDDCWQMVDHFRREGVKGFLSSQTGVDDLVKAIGQVHENKVYLAENLAQELFQRWGSLVTPPDKRLTKREVQVLKLIANGSNTQETAQKLHIANKTVDSHRANLLRKLALRNKVELALYAVRNGFVRA